MKQALKLAIERRGFCAPNPSVGSVLVKSGQVIGKGHHVAAGQPHAEINAIAAAGDAAKGATLYVTLEPCSHHGKTPPCVDAIIQAKIKQVYFGYQDPNPIVQGQGQQRLIDAGIACEYLPDPAVNQFYRSYAHWTQHKKPWVTAKLAITLDGKIANADGTPAKISGMEANAYTQKRRLHSDAILTSIQTVIHDDPRLNARMEDQTVAKKVYVLDTQCRFPDNANLYKTSEQIHILCSQPGKNNKLHYHPIESDNKGLNLNQAIQLIGEHGIHDLWVETGAKSFNALLTENLVNELILYISNQTLGEKATPAFTQAIDFSSQFHTQTIQALGNDVLYQMTLRIDSKSLP